MSSILVYDRRYFKCFKEDFDAIYLKEVYKVKLNDFTTSLSKTRC